MADMQLFVNYRCVNTGITGQLKLNICDWESKCVHDIKVAIQENLHAPICDQELFFQNKLLDSDSSPLKNMYFRQGDEIGVHFPIQVDLPEIQELLNVLKQFEFRSRVCTNLDLLLKTTYDYNKSYMDAIYALQRLAFHIFYPWKTAKSSANRRVFVQEGGFQTFMEIFKFSFYSHYSSNQAHEAVGQGNRLPDRRLLASLKVQNIHQLKLLLSCLTFLWNFSETRYERKLIIENGVLPLVTRTLLLDPGTPYSFDPLNVLRGKTIAVNEQSIGCVAVCVAFDANAQEAVVSNDEAVTAVVEMTNLHLPKTKAYDLFYSQVASMSLFYCTYNLKTHGLFVQKGIHQTVIGITKNYVNGDTGDMLMRYYGCLVLARLRSSPVVELDKETMQSIDQLIDGFLEKHKPREMLSWEQDHSYVWITLVPMIHLAFALDPHNSGGPSEYPSDACSGAPPDSGGNKTSAYAGSSQIYKRRTKSLDENMEETEDNFGSERSSTNGSMDMRDGRKVNLPLKSFVGGIGRLLELGRCPGSLSVGRLGLFALSYLLCLEENRQLIRSEGMLGYLVCLSWYLRPEERDHLQEQLNKFPDVKAPSLKIITKSFLARMRGLQVAFRM